MDMKRFFLFAIVIAALALAGCGGNGGGGMAGTTPTPTEPTEPTQPTQPPAPVPEEMALKDARDAAMAAYMMAMGYADSAKDYVAMGNAQKYADMAKDASDMAAAATTVAMAEEYQMKAEMYRDNAMEAAMMRGLEITKLANTIINQSDIDNAELEGKTGTDVPKPVSNAARVGAALTASAQGTVASTGTADETGVIGGGGTSQGSADNNAATAMATHTASGPMLAVTLPSDTADTVTRGETPTSLMTRGGWMGAELVGVAELVGDTDGISTTYANVYTDIQAPVVKDTYAADDATNTINAEGLVDDVTADPEITGDVPNDGSSFTAMYNDDPKDNNPPVPGMFSCPGAVTCSISVKDGVVEAIQGYIFQPRESIGTNRVLDADYLTWGVWLRVPDVVPAADAADPTTFAGAFASGNNVFAVYPQLKGKATYNGVANGLYSAAGMVEQFDADVMLEANFGGNVGADYDTTQGTNDGFLLGVVTGTVSNINAGGMAVDGSLMLKRALVGNTEVDVGNSVRNGFSGDTSGTLAGRDMTGEWGGQFYGPNDATTNMARQTEYPTTAAGTFGASAPGTSTDPVRILGAFGSWKAD